LTDKRVLRILDANFNRVREGLRVLEEVVRFAMDSAPLQRGFKRCRHRVGRTFSRFAAGPKALLAARDVRSDVGREPAEGGRRDLADVFTANAQRVKEALRSLEEFSKLADAVASRELKRIRFRVYDLEKRSLPKLEALRDHVSGRPGRAKLGTRRRTGDPRRRKRPSASR
jgi:thiamine-phosphate pyrophosphorylase